MVLDTSEYDKAYFDGNLVENPHRSGYSEYKKYPNTYSGKGKWGKRAEELIDDYNLTDEKVLVVGCAKGFMVEKLRDKGVDAYGLEVSSYAVENSPVKEFIDVGDVRNYTSNYSDDEFDFLYTRSLMPCLPKSSHGDVCIEFNRISKKQVHDLSTSHESDDYFSKSLEWWRDRGFTSGSEIRDMQGSKVVV